MADTITETAYAKINLALHIRARRDDGYHELETIFAFVDRGDILSAEVAETLTLKIDGPFSRGLETEGNLVLKAAEALRSHAAINSGAHLKLTKNLPIASGIGGGSADAAATLRALNRLWKLDLEERELASVGAPLGADIAACVLSRTCIGSGVGEKIREVDEVGLSGLYCLLVNPGLAVPTGPVFAVWDGVDRGALSDGPLLEVAISGRNDLQRAAIQMVPQISGILEFLDLTDPVLARMSGSGATCFAIYETENASEVAERQIADKWPDYWTMRGKLLGAGV